MVPKLGLGPQFCTLEVGLIDRLIVLSMVACHSVWPTPMIVTGIDGISDTASET